jgi:deoxyribodipyrimidine photolyase-related protein
MGEKLGGSKILQRTLLKAKMKGRILRLILGDQLNIHHSWFRSTDKHVTYVMMEVKSESEYVTHHIQKVLCFFAAMRAFADELTRQGHAVQYWKISDLNNQQSFSLNLRQMVQSGDYATLEYQHPDEYRLQQFFLQLETELGIPVKGVDSEHFLMPREEVAILFQHRKRYLLETFYRHVRKKLNILMVGDQPEGGQWNFDELNRSPIKKGLAMPHPPVFSHNLSDIADELTQMSIETIGRCDAVHFPWAITREEALIWLNWFCKHQLAFFGTYQDAMHTDEPFLFHSRLSFALNTKLISPLEVIHAAVEEYRLRPHEIHIAQVEGFVRQIAGWREFVRGIYWNEMPDYKQKNFFGHKRPLPGFFWTGDTRMNCLKQAIGQSLEWSYAHHIQRLMITGNFALLAGVNPEEVHQWYLGIYIDAIEWVELPNTLAMSQFADGGGLATKPYVSAAAYIQKMSNYCAKCAYNPKERIGETACPMNALYWNFIETHLESFKKNMRMAMPVRGLLKMTPQQREEIHCQADRMLENIEEL